MTVTQRLPCAGCNSCGVSASLREIDGYGCLGGGEEWLRLSASPGPDQDKSGLRKVDKGLHEPVQISRHVNLWPLKTRLFGPKGLP